MNENVNAIFNVIRQFTHLVPPFFFLDIEIIDIRKLVQKRIHAAQLIPQNSNLLADSFQQLVFVTQECAQLTEQRVHHPSGSAHYKASHVGLQLCSVARSELRFRSRLYMVRASLLLLPETLKFNFFFGNFLELSQLSIDYVDSWYILCRNFLGFQREIFES
jgi:hypothetical protein